MEMRSVQTNLARINFYEWATSIVPWVPEGVFFFGSKAVIALLQKQTLWHPAYTSWQMLTTVTKAMDSILMSMFMK